MVAQLVTPSSSATFFMSAPSRTSETARLFSSQPYRFAGRSGCFGFGLGSGFLTQSNSTCLDGYPSILSVFAYDLVSL